MLYLKLGWILREKGNRINKLGAGLPLLKTSKNLSDKLKFHVLKCKQGKKYVNILISEKNHDSMVLGSYEKDKFKP